MRARSPIGRVNAVLVGFAVAAGTGGFVVSAASAGPTAPLPASGTIQVYLVNTALNPATPNTVIITGAFSDHGSGKGGTWHLSKGTISLDASKLKAITSSPNFGTFYAASCSFRGVAKGPVTIVSGTGAYAGITGSLVATETVAEQGSLLTNGKCNEANNAPAVAQALIVTGSGTVAFKPRA
jgi:hypothetical protein